jgi:DNA-binding transcriptional ArsR family regulator
VVEDLAADGRGMDMVFHALAHDARRAMLRRLAGGELTVGELARPLAMSLAAASKHVQVLERAGLLHRTVAGRRHVCRLRAAPLAQAEAWLRWYEPFWDDRLDALAHLFRDARPNPTTPAIPNELDE